MKTINYSKILEYRRNAHQPRHTCDTNVPYDNICKLICIHTYILTYIQYIQKCRHISHIYRNMHININTYMHACIHAYTMSAWENVTVLMSLSLSKAILGSLSSVQVRQHPPVCVVGRESKEVVQNRMYVCELIDFSPMTFPFLYLTHTLCPPILLITRNRWACCKALSIEKPVNWGIRPRRQHDCHRHLRKGVNIQATWNKVLGDAAALSALWHKLHGFPIFERCHVYAAEILSLPLREQHRGTTCYRSSDTADLQSNGQSYQGDCKGRQHKRERWMNGRSSLKFSQMNSKIEKENMLERGKWKYTFGWCPRWRP